MVAVGVRKCIMHACHVRHRERETEERERERRERERGGQRERERDHKITHLKEPVQAL